MVINQGDLYWIEIADPFSPELGDRRPYVIVQNDVANASRSNSVIVCALTTELRRANIPGNVLLAPGEGDLPKQSVVNVSQIYTVLKVRLEDKIGTLSPARVKQILDGLWLRLEPRPVQRKENGF